MKQHDSAFTLAELMLVISIIGLLAAMLLPTLSSVMMTTRQAQCAQNLHGIGVAISALGARDKVSHSGALMIAGWRSQLQPYVSNSEEVMLCPEDFEMLKPAGQNTSAFRSGEEALGAYALRTYNGESFIYDMPLAPGPACLKTNITNQGLTYDLSFEDQRSATGEAVGDLSYDNPTITISFSGSDATITVKGGGGGYHWYLVDSEGKVLIPDLLKCTDGAIGKFVTVPGLGGRVSYGLNSVVSKLDLTSRKIMALDYPRDIARITGYNETHDNWLNYVGADGKLTFARHFGRSNVLMMEGSVVRLSPQEMDPIIPALRAELWAP